MGVPRLQTLPVECDSPLLHLTTPERLLNVCESLRESDASLPSLPSKENAVTVANKHNEAYTNTWATTLTIITSQLPDGVVT